MSEGYGGEGGELAGDAGGAGTGGGVETAQAGVGVDSAETGAERGVPGDGADGGEWELQFHTRRSSEVEGIRGEADEVTPVALCLFGNRVDAEQPGESGEGEADDAEGLFTPRFGPAGAAEGGGKEKQSQEQEGEREAPVESREPDATINDRRHGW